MVSPAHWCDGVKGSGHEKHFLSQLPTVLSGLAPYCQLISTRKGEWDVHVLLCRSVQSSCVKS